MVLTVKGGDEKKQRQDGKRLVVADYEAVDRAQVGQKHPVGIFSDGFIQRQQDGGQHQNHSGHAQRHALGHHQADIPAQQQPHEAQGQKAGHRRQRAAEQGGESGLDGYGHGVSIVVIMEALLFIPMVEENGIIHGDAQLKHGGDGLGDVRNLAKNDVCAEIIKNSGADAEQEGGGQQPGFHGGAHDDERKQHS